jgi:hypothetical protein
MAKLIYDAGPEQVQQWLDEPAAGFRIGVIGGRRRSGKTHTIHQLALSQGFTPTPEILYIPGLHYRRHFIKGDQHILESDEECPSELTNIPFLTWIHFGPVHDSPQTSIFGFV